MYVRVYVCMYICMYVCMIMHKPVILFLTLLVCVHFLMYLSIVYIDIMFSQRFL